MNSKMGILDRNSVRVCDMWIQMKQKHNNFFSAQSDMIKEMYVNI